MTTDGWSGSNDCRVLKNVGSLGEDGHDEAVRLQPRGLSESS